MLRITNAGTNRNLRLWLSILGMVISAFLFEEIVDDVFRDPMEGDFEAKHFDTAVQVWIAGLRSPAITQTMIDLTALGSVSVNFVLLFIFTSILFTYRDYKGLSFLVIVAAGAGAWPLILKNYFARPRPEIGFHLVNVSDLSFPSGHAFGATSIYIALALYAARYARTLRHEIFFYCLGFFLVILVGVSRVYLGVHYPTDVMAGVCGGIFWALFIWAMFTLVTPEKKSEEVCGT